MDFGTGLEFSARMYKYTAFHGWHQWCQHIIPLQTFGIHIYVICTTPRLTTMQFCKMTSSAGEEKLERVQLLQPRRCLRRKSLPAMMKYARGYLILRLNESPKYWMCPVFQDKTKGAKNMVGTN